jgi:hypothetical protein
MKAAHEHSKLKHESYPNIEISGVVDKEMPSFVGKLFAMLGDARAKEHIAWSECGDRILIPDPGQFSRRVLPM